MNRRELFKAAAALGIAGSVPASVLAATEPERILKFKLGNNGFYGTAQTSGRYRFVLLDTGYRATLYDLGETVVIAAGQTYKLNDGVELRLC